jgi:hypothetical protein
MAYYVWDVGQQQKNVYRLMQRGQVEIKKKRIKKN